ncbi:O-antigen polymerase [Haloferacaceae archaeon DSL9]
MEIGDRGRALADRWGGPLAAVVFAASVAAAAWQLSIFPMLFASLVLLLGYPWYRSVREGSLDLFEPIIFHSIFSGMIAVALFDRVYLSAEPLRYDIISRSYAEAFILLCALYALLIASTLVGYYRLGPRLPSLLASTGRLRRVIRSAERAPGRAFRYVGVGYLILGVVSLVLIVLVVFPTNSPLYVFQTSQPRSQVFAENNVFVMGTRGLYVGYLFWIAGGIVDRYAPSPAELFAAVPIVGLVLLTGGRARAFQIFIMVAVVYYYIVIEDAVEVFYGAFARIAGKTPPAVVFVFLPLFGLAGALMIVVLRGLRLGQSIGESILEVNPVSVLTAGIHNDQFDNFLALVELVPEQIGYFYGSFYARVPANLVPRALWPEKPEVYVGGLFRRAVLPNQSGGRYPGAMGDYFINLGYPGILVFGALYGVVLHLLYRLVDGGSIPALRLLLFAIFLPVVAQTGLTNNVLNDVQIHLLLLAPGIVALAALSRSHSS